METECNTIVKCKLTEGVCYWIYLPRTEEDIRNDYWPQVMVKQSDLLGNNAQVIPTLERIAQETSDRIDREKREI